MLSKQLNGLECKHAVVQMWLVAIRVGLKLKFNSCFTVTPYSQPVPLLHTSCRCPLHTAWPDGFLCTRPTGVLYRFPPCPPVMLVLGLNLYKQPSKPEEGERPLPWPWPLRSASCQGFEISQLSASSQHTPPVLPSPGEHKPVIPVWVQCFLQDLTLCQAGSVSKRPPAECQKWPAAPRLLLISVCGSQAWCPRPAPSWERM